MNDDMKYSPTGMDCSLRADGIKNLLFSDASASEKTGSDREGFEERFSMVEQLPPEEQKEVLLDELRGHLSDEDNAVINEIISILEKEPEGDNRLVELTDRLRKKFPAINEIAVTQYYLLLAGIGIVCLDKE